MVFTFKKDEVYVILNASDEQLANFQKSLKLLRHAAGYKQYELAQKMGFTPNGYRAIEIGKVGLSKPNYITLMMIFIYDSRENSKLRKILSMVV